MIGLACARRLPEKGDRQGNQHKDRADRKDAGAKRRRLPFGEDRHHGMNDSDLAERRIERAHGRQGIRAVREVTGSGKINDADLLGSPKLKRQLAAAKKR